MKDVSFRNAIENDGFALAQDVFADEELDHLLADIRGAGAKRSRAGVRHLLRFDPVARLARSAQLTEFVREVLGENGFPYRATLFDKSPVSNWLVAWHQDTALPLREKLELPGWGPWSLKDGITYGHAPASVLQQILALRVHLNDSTLENGPLRILPGSHTHGILTDDSIRALASGITPVDCTVPKGGIVAMRPLLVHGSSKSQSEMPRMVLHIEYAASPLIAAPLELAVA